MTTTNGRPSRSVKLTSRGHPAGPVIRLVSPGDLGELLKPFVFLDLAEMAPGPDSAMRWHPHSGIGTLTIIHEGRTAYRETTGVSGHLDPGGVEWMASGRGVWHTASPVGTARLKGFQVWLLLPEGADLAAPRSMYLSADEVPARDGVRVILGQWDGMRSAVPAPPETILLDVTLAPGVSWTFTVPADHEVCWMAVHKGEARLGEDTFRAGDLVVFDDGPGDIPLQSDEGCAFIIGSARRSTRHLHIGSHSVHVSAEALAAGEAEIARLGAQMRAQGLI